MKNKFLQKFNHLISPHTYSVAVSVVVAILQMPFNTESKLDTEEENFIVI